MEAVKGSCKCMYDHPGEGNESVAVYYIGENKVEVFGYWDLKTPNGQYSHFYIYVNDDVDPLNIYPWCIPIIPTREEVEEKFFFD